MTGLVSVAQEVASAVIAIADALEAMASGEISESRKIEGTTIAVLAEILEKKGLLLHEAANKHATAELAEMRREIEARKQAEVAEA